MAWNQKFDIRARKISCAGFSYGMRYLTIEWWFPINQDKLYLMKSLVSIIMYFCTAMVNNKEKYFASYLYGKNLTCDFTMHWTSSFWVDTQELKKNSMLVHRPVPQQKIITRLLLLVHVVVQNLEQIISLRGVLVRSFSFFSSKHVKIENLKITIVSFQERMWLINMHMNNGGNNNWILRFKAMLLDYVLIW